MATFERLEVKFNSLPLGFQITAFQSFPNSKRLLIFVDKEAIVGDSGPCLQTSDELYEFKGPGDDEPKILYVCD